MLRSALPGVTSVGWTAHDRLGNEIAAGTAPVSALGGFDLEFVTPTTANLGSAEVRLNATGPAGVEGSTTHLFQLAEFRRPEFEVNTAVVSSDPRTW